MNHQQSSIRRTTRIILLFSLLLTAMLYPTQAPAALANPSASWDLATDFRLAPNPENPNSDSLGNPSVWEFRESASLTHDPNTYTLLPNFIPNAFGIPGLQEWHGTVDYGGNNVLSRVGINTTGSFQQALSIAWPAGVVTVHPLPAQLVVVGWHSPIDGVVSVTGGVADMDPNCGNGIVWSIDKGTATLASGSYADGGQQPFAAGTGGANLDNITVQTGDHLYFIVDSNGEYGCDSTALDVTITAVGPTNQPPDCSAALPSLSTIWPPNGKFVPITIQGITDPDQNAITTAVTSIRQDEPVTGHGSNAEPDGRGVGTSTAAVRAERLGNGNGRVYHIGFTASDGQGGMCAAEVTVGVPHDQGHGKVPVDNGPLYDSTVVLP